ncbi:MAG: LamG domain-containing protein, partial [Planctomycetota bacterium]
LRWAAGFGANLHQVYFGDNFANVNDADTSDTTGIYRGAQADTTYTPGPLGLDSLYYWRVDEVTTGRANKTHKGDVWSFTTAPEIGITDPNLLCWWMLDEGTGVTAFDWSGHGNNGTFNNDPEWVDGYDGHALYLGGDFDPDTVVYYFGAAEPWPAGSVALWVRADTVGQNQNSSAFSSHFPNTSGFQIDVDGTYPGNYRYRGEGSHVIGPVTTKWVHLAAVWDGTSMNFYYNGSSAGSLTVAAVDTTFNRFAIGTNRNANNWLAGTIDDFRVYDKTLTQDELRQVIKVNPLRARDPSPADGATDVTETPTLRWTAGDRALQHDVYLGTDEEAVRNANMRSPEYEDTKDLGFESYDPGKLEWNTTYYWRVDEYNTDATISEGRVWSFKTAGAGGRTGDVLTQVVYDQDHTTNGLLLDTGGDVDTEVVSVGRPPEQALRTGNGEVLPSANGNRVEDYYMQFRIDDEFIFRGSPTSRVQIEIEYLDEGTDTFNIQYDAISGGHEGDGRFKGTGVVVKTNSGEFKTAVFSLCDAYFGNRDNGADFRIADSADGAEVIRRVAVNLLAPKSGPVTHYVDSCGANPHDDQPDSDAIQACIDQACSGDTVLFTSGVNSLGYQGYTIDKTVFLVRSSGKSDLTFSSTDPNNHALLTASPDLLGFVVQLFARSGIGNGGSIDNITFNHIDVDDHRAERKCYGADGIGNGRDDNWGSWVPECQVFDDAWCSPGALSMAGQVDVTDPEQDYLAHPERWSTGLVVRDVTLSNTECGTALALWGAACVIDSVIIHTAGDHVHRQGCEPTDPDEAIGGWSDGITFAGPAHRIINNFIIDASDIGIVTFGGRDTIIANNTIIAQPGNNGMFAGIAVHPFVYGLLSDFQVVGNHV